MILAVPSKAREQGIGRLMLSLAVRLPTSSELTARICVEINKAGGKAVADYNSVVDGDKIIETAIKAFGTVHILINNAGTVNFDTDLFQGILRDVSFKNMKDQDWDLIYDVHVKGSYKVYHS
jgi:multifunctional beta-oxidation protein